MKSAFQKGAALLSDIAATREKNISRLWWLGQSGFLVVKEKRGFVFDPYLSDSLTRKYANTEKPHVRVTERVIEPAILGTIGCIDAITSSHNHTDHLDAESLLPLLSANPQSRLVIAAANHDFVLGRLGSDLAPRLVQLDHGQSARLATTEFHGIAAAHNTVERDASGHCKYLGYVVRWNGMTIYHSGDTLLHDSLVPALKPFEIDIALLPINGDHPERKVAGNLDGRQAAQLAHDIGARLVIPCHFDMFEFNTASTTDFVAECDRLKQPHRVLRNGEGLALNPSPS